MAQANATAGAPSTSAAPPPVATPPVDVTAVMAMMAAFMAQNTAPKAPAARLLPGKLSLDFPKSGSMTGMVEELESWKMVARQYVKGIPSANQASYLVQFMDGRLKRAYLQAFKNNTHEHLALGEVFSLADGLVAGTTPQLYDRLDEIFLFTLGGECADGKNPRPLIQGLTTFETLVGHIPW